MYSVAARTSSTVTASPLRRLPDDEGHLDLELGVDEVGVAQFDPAGHDHVVEQRAEVGLVDLHLLLHRPRRQADLAADELGAIGDLQVDPCLLHDVGVVDRQVRVLDGDRVDGLDLAACPLVALGELERELGGDHRVTPWPSAPTVMRCSSLLRSRIGCSVAVEVEHAAGLLVPTRHDRVGPEVASPLIVDAPPQRLVARVAGEVVGGVDLDAVPVGIAEVEVERVGDAVPARTALDVVELVGRTQRVGEVEDVVRLGTREREVVQPRRRALRRRDVVHRLLAEHPRRVQRAVVVLDGLRQPEAEAGVPLVERLHVVGDEVDVVEPVDAGAVAQVVALMMVTDPLDLVEVLDDEAERDPRTRTVGPTARVVPAG